METAVLPEYLPWIGGLVAAGLMMVSRLLTNALISRRHDDILLRGSSVGILPVWISVLYLLGQAGLVFFWSFWIRWWAPIVAVTLYFLVNFIPSKATVLTGEIKNGPYKKCATCRTVRGTSYFAIDRSTPDQMSPGCVACTDPAVWAFTQGLKARFNP